MSEEIMTSATRKRKFPSGALIFLIVIIVIVVIFTLANKTEDSEEVGLESQTEITEQGMTTGEIMKLGGIGAFDWVDHDLATKNLEVLGEDQYIEDYVVTDPTDSNIVYFTTYAPCCGYGTPEGDIEMSVYRYYMDNHNFERLYHATHDQEGSFSYLGEGIPQLHALGYDNGRLIILARIYDHRADPSCTDLLLLGTDNRDNNSNLLSISIDDPYAGFEEYTPPEEILEAARNWQAECQSQN